MIQTHGDGNGHNVKDSDDDDDSDNYYNKTSKASKQEAINSRIDGQGIRTHVLYVLCQTTI